MSLSVNVITVSGFCRQGSDDWIHILKDMSTAIQCTNYTLYVIIHTLSMLEEKMIKIRSQGNLISTLTLKHSRENFRLESSSSFVKFPLELQTKVI